MDLNDLIRQKHSKLALQINKRMENLNNLKSSFFKLYLFIFSEQTVLCDEQCLLLMFTHINRSLLLLEVIQCYIHYQLISQLSI